jgi:hypothetical protein
MLVSQNIPKVIHYCWFGGNPLPPLALKCIESWEKYFPDYEIKEWNESNFDVNMIPYTEQAQAAKKYAFVSDYARLWVLDKYGGVYFDTDVEAVKSFDDILNEGAFIGLESTEEGSYLPALGLGFACAPGSELVNELMRSYENDNFITPDGKQDLSTIVIRTANILKKHGFVEKNEIQKIQELTVYPVDYFCPKDFATGKLIITKNTHSIHWYDASWQPKSSKVFYSLVKRLPQPLRSGLKRFLKIVKGK